METQSLTCSLHLGFAYALSFKRSIKWVSPAILKARWKTRRRGPGVRGPGVQGPGVRGPGVWKTGDLVENARSNVENTGYTIFRQNMNFPH